MLLSGWFSTAEVMAQLNMTNYVMAFDYHAATDRYVVGYQDRSIHIGAVTTQIVLSEMQLPDYRPLLSAADQLEHFYISAVVFNPSGTQIAVSFDGTLAMGLVVIVDVPTGEVVQQLDIPAPVQDVDWSPNGEQIGVAYSFYPQTRSVGFVGVWDVETGEALNNYDMGLDTKPLDIDWHPSQARIAFVRRNQVILWDVENWRELSQLSADYTIAFTSLSWSPDGHSLAAIGTDGTLRFWDGETYEPVEELRTSIMGVERLVHPQLFWSATSSLIGVFNASLFEVWDPLTGIPIMRSKFEQRIVGAALNETLIEEQLFVQSLVPEFGLQSIVLLFHP